MTASRVNQLIFWKCVVRLSMLHILNDLPREFLFLKESVLISLRFFMKTQRSFHKHQTGVAVHSDFTFQTKKDIDLLKE